jgi:gliding motility-associated-like protein
MLFLMLFLFSFGFAAAQCPVTVKAYVTGSQVVVDRDTLDEYSLNDYEAPVEIRFDAINDLTTALYVWEIIKIDPISKDSIPILRYPAQSVTYTFQESGLFRAKLEVIPQATDPFFCSDLSFDIQITESLLKLPNAFSPGTSIGSNDIYRVSYKSIVSFKASIFNRWGKLLFTWRDPSKGWDGKFEGKYVPTGVYFIIVEAEGADGKIYQLSKDINILR